MKKSVKILFQILLWGILSLIPLYIMMTDTNTDSRAYMGYLIRTGILAVLFYANYLLLIDKLLFNKHFWKYILVNVTLVAVLTGTQSLILKSADYGNRPHRQNMESMERYRSDIAPDRDESFTGDNMRKDFNKRMPPKPDGFFAMRIFTDYLLIFLVIGMSVALRATDRWYRDSIKLQETKNVQLEADLRNLRSQLNPHFLFNTLNNIYSLIAIDTQKAQDSVHRLSGLLRYVLYDNDEKFVPIQKELEFTRNYIDLMKLRMGSNVRITVDIDDNGSLDRIASLMFMTLIENAFKHGLNTVEGSFIDIRIFVDKGKGVLCTVENSLSENDKNVESKNSGIGLTNLSSRLNLLYPNKHELRIEKRLDSFFTLLRVDFV